MIDRLNAALEGRYRIERALGEGGMATVYLADDVKHERRVALKVLKPELAAVVGAERFLAEIKTTANLQHPHILPLHDSGQADGFLFYVMPYVEGETLKDKLERERQLPVDEAIRIASDMAEALDYAHRQGIIHRDIKPANVLMQEGRPVIADFGIALAVGSAGGARLTETGLSVGTPFYMSPEQATGDQVIGHQSDTYALGCVLYEMLIGEPPYVGATAQAILGKIIQGGPVSATAQRQSIPPNVDAVIRKSLEKLPADRFASAAGFAGALREPGFRHGAVAGGESGRRAGWTRTTSAVAATAAVAIAALGWALARPEAPASVERFAFDAITPQQFSLGAIAVGPPGSGMVYYGPTDSGGGFQLWYRRFDDLEATPVPNSVGGEDPQISPDGTEVAFSVAGELRVVPLAGGVPRTLTDSVFCCATWSLDGTELFYTRLGNTIARIPAAGGAPQLVVNASGAGIPAWLRQSPGGRLGVITLFSDAIRIEAVDLATGERTHLTDGLGAVPTRTGHLVFTSLSGTLLAAPLGGKPLELTGAAVPIVEGVLITGGQVPRWSLNENGTLAYWEGQGGSGFEMVWVTRSGVATEVDPNWEFDPGGGNRGWSLSPDGTRVAIRIATEAGNDIWIKELEQGPLTRLTFFEGEDRDPGWMPDSRTVTFLSGMPIDGDSRQAGDLNLWAQRADGSGRPELLFDHDVSISEAVVHPDSRSVVVRSSGVASVQGGRDVYAATLGENPEARAILDTPFDESAPTLSPDGRWLAYQSNESGRDEIYVRPYPDTESARVQVSTAGGLAPRWSRDGGEIFFLDGERRMNAATVEVSENRLTVSARETLFTLSPGTIVGDRTTQYDVGSDGRFLMVRNAAGEDGESRFVVVRNFLELVKARVGGGR